MILTLSREFANVCSFSWGLALVRRVDVSRNLDFSIEQSYMFCRSSKSNFTMHRGTFVPYSRPECLCARHRARRAGCYTYICLHSSTTRRIRTAWSRVWFKFVRPDCSFPPTLQLQGLNFQPCPTCGLRRDPYNVFSTLQAPRLFNPATGKTLICSSLWLLNVSLHGKKLPLISTVYT